MPLRSQSKPDFPYIFLTHCDSQSLNIKMAANPIAGLWSHTQAGRVSKHAIDVDSGDAGDLES